ncbi:MAG: ATP-binding protein [bacterium]|nr:ATP-binding protein [bacterium]
MKVNKKTILIQKQERDRLIGLPYVSRDQLPQAKKLLANDLVKIIIGPRRAGKSVFALELLKDQNFAYLNFEDEKLRDIEDNDEIIDLLDEVYNKPKYFLFDEIGRVKDWEMWVNKLHRRGRNLVLTGSNANLLSGELATALTGRHFTIEIYPFSYSEFLRAKNLSGGATNEFMALGGFPEVVTKDIDSKYYLKSLIDSTILKDIVLRHIVGMPSRISLLANHFFANITGHYTINSLKNLLEFSSFASIDKYISYLEETFLLISLMRFSYKYKTQAKAARKIYTIDNGFVGTSFNFSPDYGKLLENLVFMELVRRGYRPNLDLFYYQTRNGKEVDFILKRGYKVEQLIQVCYNLDNDDTKKREESAIKEAQEELSCKNSLIITGDNLEEWLLKK